MSVTISVEVDVDYLRDNAWGGAVDTLDAMTDEQVDTILGMLDESNCGMPMTEDELNSFFWFDDETIAEWLGFDDFEQLEKHNNDEDDEEGKS